MLSSGPWGIVRSLLRTAALTAGFLGSGSAGPARAADAPLAIEVMGGLAGVTQYTQHEEPFWTRRVPALTGGRLTATVTPFDRRGIRGQEVLPLMRLGVIPFGSVLLGLASADEPELNAVDLPGASPDMPTLRATVAAWRPHLRTLLRDRYDVELLAVYTYPAQVVFCRDAFAGLADLAGRRIRTSSVAQSEFVRALGGTPVVIPFADIMASIRTGVVQCAITGTLSGHAIGLHEVTTHVSRQAIGWGISIFGANTAAWEALPESLRTALEAGLGRLEAEIWAAAEAETEDGFACNAGRPACRQGRPGRMTVIEAGAADDALRARLLETAVVPAWIRRCGESCAEAWARVGRPYHDNAAAASSRPR